jgi:hypothetical protein
VTDTATIREASETTTTMTEYAVHLRYRKPRGGERPADKLVVEPEKEARQRAAWFVGPEAKRYGTDVISATLLTRTKTVVTTTTEWTEPDALAAE